MTQAHFKQFWEIARNWRPTDTARPGAAAREFHKRVKEGIDPEEILRGARNYTDGALKSISYPVSPHNWLMDWCWTEYQDAPERYVPLNQEERKAWQESATLGNGPERKKEGTECWPPGLRVVP